MTTTPTPASQPSPDSPAMLENGRWVLPEPKNCFVLSGSKLNLPPSDIVFHGGTEHELRITSSGVTYRGETVADALGIHRVLLEVVMGARNLPPPAHAVDEADIISFSDARRAAAGEAQPKRGPAGHPDYPPRILLEQLNNGDRWDANCNKLPQLYIGHRGPHEVLRRVLVDLGLAESAPSGETIDALLEAHAAAVITAHEHGEGGGYYLDLRIAEQAIRRATTGTTAAPSGDDLHKAALDLLNCMNGLPIDTDEATAAALTAFDRTRSRLQKALARRATAGNTTPTDFTQCEWCGHSQPSLADADFKNFHRLLCERFGYAHDDRDWKRDQLSLIEFIASKSGAAPSDTSPVGATRTPTQHQQEGKNNGK